MIKCREPKYAFIDGTCYYFEVTEKTHENAQKNCREMFGRLFEPTSMEILNKVSAKAKQLGDTHWHIGINDIENEGTFKYATTGSAIPFVNGQFPWGSGEPNNRDGNEDCAHIHRLGYMNDVNCESTFYSICELL